MPWIPLYLTELDASALINMLAQDPEIAFIVHAGPKQWRAIKSINSKNIEQICLWHVPSGPLPLLPAIYGDPVQQVKDPWLGWTERRTGANPKTPYFGVGHPGIIWINIRTRGKDPGSCCGLSSFGWIGNHYKIIGNSAAPNTQAWWKSLRLRVAKLSHKVPRQKISNSLPSEIFSFPGAYILLKEGGIADANP